MIYLVKNSGEKLGRYMSNLTALYGKETNGFSLTCESAGVAFEAPEIPWNIYLKHDEKTAFFLRKQRCLPSEQA
jgi:hypothetical protein